MPVELLEGDRVAASALRRAVSTGRRILLVDDNTDAAELMAELLRGVGHEVAVAHDGPAALLEAPRFNPDVAVLDIGLPVMDGYELARRLIAMLRDPPFMIALTGYGQENDRARARDAGFDEHMVKPADPERLLELVELSDAPTIKARG